MNISELCEDCAVANRPLTRCQIGDGWTWSFLSHRTGEHEMLRLTFIRSHYQLVCFIVYSSKTLKKLRFYCKIYKQRLSSGWNLRASASLLGSLFCELEAHWRSALIRRSYCARGHRAVCADNTDNGRRWNIKKHRLRFNRARSSMLDSNSLYLAVWFYCTAHAALCATHIVIGHVYYDSERTRYTHC